jgi:Ca2+-binding EF-hand superfamily protein
MDLTREQNEECKSVFSLFDRKNDQTIASTDIGLALRGLRVSISDAELKIIADDVERNRGGKLSFDQFKQMFADHSRDILTPEKLQGYFAALDTSRTGKIRVAELKNALLNQNEHISEPEIDEILKDFGVSGDGEVDYRSFSTFLLA